MDSSLILNRQETLKPCLVWQEQSLMSAGLTLFPQVLFSQKYLWCFLQPDLFRKHTIWRAGDPNASAMQSQHQYFVCHSVYGQRFSSDSHPNRQRNSRTSDTTSVSVHCCLEEVTARKSTCSVVRMYIFTQCISSRDVFLFFIGSYLFSHSSLYFQCWTYLRKWDHFGML